MFENNTNSGRGKKFLNFIYDIISFKVSVHFFLKCVLYSLKCLQKLDHRSKYKTQNYTTLRRKHLCDPGLRRDFVEHKM